MDLFLTVKDITGDELILRPTTLGLLFTTTEKREGKEVKTGTLLRDNQIPVVIEFLRNYAKSRNIPT